MLPHFFAMNRQNYARYLPVYLADMQQLELTHPDVYNEFSAGNHTISRSGQPFLQVSTDMALEQSINTDSKSSGGVIGISQIPSALERWFLTIHAVGFWEPIPNMKIKTFSSTNKKIRVKSSDKLVTVNADRDLFGRLLIVSNTRQICLKEELSFELSPVPYSPANADGSLRKGAKSVLCSLLEKDVNVQRLKASPNPTVVIVDGMAVIQMSKSAGASTFGELSEKYCNIISAPLFSNNCVQVHVVFDQSWENSIKGGERQRRGASVAREVQIGGPATPVLRQWGKYIANPTNKVWLKLLNLTSFTLNTNFLFRYRQFEVVIEIFCV